MSEATKAPEERAWTRVILPRRGLLELPLRELWSYRDLILLMSFRDLSANYKQTLLGPIWFVLQPLMATFFFAFIFGRMAKMGTDGLPALLFYFSGITLWSYLAECVNKTATTFTRHAHVFGKVYFPRLVVPAATCLTGLVGLMVQFSIFLVFLTSYWAVGQPVHPSWRIIFFPLMVLQLAMLGVGLGCIVATFSTRFRDLTLGVGFAVQLWMYSSSVVFPLSRVAEENRWLFLLNPVVPIIEGFRFAFLGFGIVGRVDYVISVLVCTVVFVVGVTLFSHAEQTAMDNV